MQALSLKELTQEIQLVLHQQFNQPYWVTAEISELKENRNGHCYLELIEKDAKKDRITAKMRGIVWANIYRMLKPHFLSETGREFDAGLKVMLKVSVAFHERFGLSLQISDIDPTYTLGDIARRRQEILQQLEDEGVLNMNKDVELPMVPQRIAVISSATAAGYQDFINQLQHNERQYQIHHELFEAYMQGNDTESSVIQALEQVHTQMHRFDAVAIIRGGGSRSDLGYFDSYMLAINVAQFPMPVITGIGHEKDTSITDMVAHTSLKTPTALAGFLLERFAFFEDTLNDYATTINQRVRQFVDAQQETLSGTIYRIRAAHQQRINQAHLHLESKRNHILHATRGHIHEHTTTLSHMRQKLVRYSQRRLLQEETNLQQIPPRLKLAARQIIKNQENQAELHYTRSIAHDPQSIMKKGYTLTFCNGSLLKSPAKIKTGDKLETRFSGGKVYSRVEDATQMEK